jgi:kynurenine formamidase
LYFGPHADLPLATPSPWLEHWGDFGPDDQLGRLNLLTDEKVRQAAAEVRAGRRFCLSLPLDYPGEAKLNARRHPPRLRPTELNGDPFMNHALTHVDARNTDVVCDDQVTLSLQYSTQWDSFAHVGSYFDADGDGIAEQVYYNGFRAHEHVLGPGDAKLEQVAGDGAGSHATALGIETFAVHAIQGRGVLADLHAHLGNERTLVGYEQLAQILKTDGVEVEPGDMLLLHTGYAELVLGMNRKPDPAVLHGAGAVLDGRDPKLRQWITDTRVAALCADNYAVEAYPARETTGPENRPALPLHEHCLFKLGVPLGELWWLGDLAQWLRANKRSRFLLTAPPLRLPGAVGSPVTPVATV